MIKLKNIFKMLVSRSNPDTQTKKILNKTKIKNILYRGSSLKFYIIAESLAYIYFKLRKIKELDITAWYVILKNTDASLTNLNFKEIVYGKKNFINELFLAISNSVKSKFKEMIFKDG